MEQSQKTYDIPAMIKWQEKYIDALKELKSAMEKKLSNIEQIMTTYDDKIETANLKIKILQLESDIEAKEKIYKESFVTHSKQDLITK
jgi:hypothetical protein